MAHILNGTDTVRSFDLKNKINLLSFHGNLNDKFTLIVIKNGYGRFTRHFDIAELIAELNNKPLKVYLGHAFTILANFHSTTIYPYIVSDSNFTVDWGDGTSDSYTSTDYNGPEDALVHNYPSRGEYFISVTGDLDAIKNLEFWNVSVSKINMEYLPELATFIIYNVGVPKTIDFSHNPKISIISFEDVARFVENIYLPTTHDIRIFEISGPVSIMSTSAIDSIIDNVHANTLNKNIMDGHFTLRNYYYPLLDEGPDQLMVGPPSEEALVKLRELRDVYGWNIDPNS